MASTVGLERAPKRHVKAASSSVVRNRIRAFRELCNPSREALVFIPGVDGKFNDGSRKALNYLLYGSSGPEIEQSNRNNPELEDMIAVVSAGMCFLYVGKQEVHERLLPLVGEVAGLQLFTLYDEEAQDMDLSEERKILSFLEMVEPFKAIGTELTQGYDAGSGKGPAMELENWPLIQVYGVEELGNRGFFTMRHAVSDVGPDLRKVYGRLDRHAVEQVSTHHVDLLAFHWETAVSLLDSHTPKERLQISEEALCEPLQSYFSYGLMRSTDKEAQATKRPRVVMGIRTNDRKAESGKTRVCDGGEDGKVAVHLIMEASEPNGPVMLSRTLFLSSGGAAARPRTFDFDKNETELDDNQLSRSGRSAYARCLMAAYCAVTSVHAVLVDAFCKGECTDTASLRAKALTTLDAMRVEWLRNTEIGASLSVELTATDLHGSPADASRGSRHAKFLRVELAHIISLDSPSVDLGAVAYGDTFMDAAGSTECLSLTAGIQRMAGWMGAGQEEDTPHTRNLMHRLQANNKHVHTTMGSLVYDDPVSGVRMLTSCDGMPFLAGKLWVLQKGLVFASNRLGSVVVDFEHDLVSAEFYTSSESVAFRLREGFASFGILESTPGATGSLILGPGAADRKIFSREVLHMWHTTLEDMGVPTTAKDSLPPALASSVWHKPTEEISVNDMALPDHKAFLDVYETLDSCGHRPSAAPPSAAQPPPDSEPIIVVMGQPGLDKKKLVDEAISLVGKQDRISIVCYENRTHPGEVDATILSTLLHNNAQPSHQTVLIASTYASAASLASALSHCKGVHVDRISAVINATSFTYPCSGAVDASVASQCAGGFASSVVLVNTEQCEPDQLASLQHQMRHLCPTSRIVRTVAGRVTSRDDIVTLLLPREEDEGGPPTLVGFYSPAMVEARARISPGWDLLNSKQHSVDVWSDRRGAVTYHSFPIPSSSGITFIRPPLVMSIRSLFRSPNAALDTFVAASSAPGGAMDVLHITACLPVAKTGETSPEMCVIKAKRGCVTVTAVKKSEAVASSISVTGRNIDVERIVKAVLGGRPPIPQPPPLRCKSDLTKEEREAIKHTSIEAPLPEGFFFNGTNFVDFDGTTYQYHPEMDRLIAEYLDKANDAVRAQIKEASQAQNAYDADLHACIASARKAV